MWFGFFQLSKTVCPEEMDMLYFLHFWSHLCAGVCRGCACSKPKKTVTEMCSNKYTVGYRTLLRANHFVWTERASSLALKSLATACLNPNSAPRSKAGRGHAMDGRLKKITHAGIFFHSM